MRCCHPSPHPLVSQEVGVQEIEGGRPSSLPSQPLLKCGEGEPPPLLQRGAQREQVTCPKSSSTVGLEARNTGLPKVRAVALGLC